MNRPVHLSRCAGEVAERSDAGEGRDARSDRALRPSPASLRSATSPAQRERCTVLAIAGSDSGGGAGIQADIKTIASLGGYATTAITALTAQDTLGVHAIHAVPPDFVVRQIEVVLDDIGADAIKTGMLGDTATIEAVAGALARLAPGVPLVVDPVMVAKGGAALLHSDALAALIRLLLPAATLLTPNLPEAEVLSGLAIPDLDAMPRAAEALLRRGRAARCC